MVSSTAPGIGVGLALRAHPVALVGVAADVLLAGATTVVETRTFMPEHGLTLVRSDVGLAAAVDPAVAGGAVGSFGAEVEFVLDLTHLDCQVSGQLHMGC